MSSDLPSSTTADQVSAIENEIPSYRAISGLAITSLLFGLASILSFADSWFLICTVVAILLGILAERKIRRLPDLLTGRGFAQAGIALGLIFGLSSTTFATVQILKLRRSAEQYGRAYAKVLQTADPAQAFWYTLPAAAQKGSDPDQVFAEMTKSAKSQPMSMEGALMGIKAIQAKVKTEGRVVGFKQIEQAGYDRTTGRANVVLELKPRAGDAKSQSEYALIMLRSDTQSPGLRWMVEEVNHPYRLGSHGLKETVETDEHGHQH